MGNTLARVMLVRTQRQASLRHILLGKVSFAPYAIVLQSACN